MYKIYTLKYFIKKGLGNHEEKYAFSNNILIVFAILITLIFLAACSSEPEIFSYEPEYVFVPEFASSSDFFGNLPNISNILVTGSKIYFTSTSELRGDSLLQTTQIYSVNHNGTNLQQLINYTSDYDFTGIDGGGTFITALYADKDGYIWIAEVINLITYDFPNNVDIDSLTVNEIREHQVATETKTYIAQLDGSGASMNRVNARDIISNTPGSPIGINAIKVDENSNIYIAVGLQIYVLDSKLNSLFSLETDDFVFRQSLVTLNDGRVAYFNSSAINGTLRVIDVDNQGFSDTINLPDNTIGVFNGSSEHLFYINDGGYLVAFNDTLELETQVLHWLSSGVDANSINNMQITENNTIILTIFGSTSIGTSFVTLEKTPTDEIIEKQTITLATFMPSLFNNAILEFNRTNRYFQIETQQLEDIFESPESFDRLALDVLRGQGPDIINTHVFPFQQWAGRGLFVDLFSLIDSDPELSRTDFIDSFISALETNGSLYKISNSVDIRTLMGHADVVGDSVGWTISELQEVIEQNPQATIPFGDWFDGLWFINTIINANIDAYVNWEEGIPSTIGNFSALSTNSGLSILANSANQEGAWEFIRFFVSEDWQRESLEFAIPTNRTVFYESLERAKNIEPDTITNLDEMMIYLTSMSQDEADIMLDLIYSASTLLAENDPIRHIVEENLSEFFAGLITAQDAARIIQSRASIFVAEQIR